MLPSHARLSSLSSSRFSQVALAATLLLAPLHPRAQDQAPAPPTPTTVIQPASPPPAPAPASPAREEQVGPILLRDDSLAQVLELVQRWTGRTLLRPQALPTPTFTLTLDKVIPKSEGLLALETLLNLNGIALTPVGDQFLKVTPLALARTETPELIQGSTLELPPSGRIAAKLFQLEFLRAGEIVPQLSTLINPALGGAPVVFEKSNALLITDSISNLQRVEDLIRQLDQPILAGLATKIYTLQFAKASDLVNKVRTMIAGPLQTQLGTATSLNPDDRTNKIILISDPRQHPFFDELIAQLDVRADPNTRNDVIFLKNADATEVSTLLTQLVTGQNTAARTAGQETPAPGQRAATQAAARQAAAAARASGNDPAAAAAAATQASNTANAVSAAASSTAASSEQFSTLLTILPDVRSNSLVISGTADDLQLIRTLVNRIDILLSQVRIEVVIAEVTLSNEASSGIEELGLRIDGDRLTGFTGSASGAAVGGLAPDDFATLRGPGALSGILSLSTTPRKNNTNILSVPTIVTTHNKRAEIFVGETRPVISGTTNTPVSGGSGFSTSSSVTQQEIGIRLIVTPLIGPDGSVQMEIEQEVKDVIGDVIIDNNTQPIVGTRTTNSFVSANNGDIIVLGGLQRTTRGRTSSRLGPIPLLGDLFGKRTRRDVRTDLVFFLRPIVLTNTEADNADALARVDAGPQAAATRALLDRPAPQPASD